MANEKGPRWRQTTDDLRKQLYEFVKDSSEKNRQYFIGWVLFTVYVFVTVAGTTDLQLLVPESGVSLPVLGIQMPLFSFYLAVPLLILAIHFNLLQNLDNHALKIEQWRDAWDGTPPIAAVNAFLFDYAALGRSRAFTPLVGIASDFLCYWLGPLLLATILIRFSDYQSPIYTTFHFGVLMIDVALVAFALRSLPRFGRSSTRWRQILRGTVMTLAIVVASSLTILPLLLSWGLYLGHPTADFVMSRLFFWYDRPEFFSELLIPRLFVDPNAQITSVDGQVELRAKVDGKAVDVWWREQGRGVDLAGRNLNYATLKGTNLRKANFTGARMRRIDLSGAALQQAVFTAADLEGADLEEAKMQGATFNRSVNLGSAMLESARLDGASGFQTILAGADLRGANLSGTSMLRWANLSGAYLDGAIMYGADLSSSRLDGAYFVETQLQGADLSSASLLGTYMLQTHLRGAKLDNTRIEGAYLAAIVPPSNPGWTGSPISLAFGKRSTSPNWDSVLREMPDDDARQRILDARMQVEAEVEPKQEIVERPYADLPVGEGVAIVNTLAANLCWSSQFDSWQQIMRAMMHRWPRPSGLLSYSDSDDYDSKSVYLRQELLIRLLDERTCERQRRSICSAALDAMGKVSLFIVAPSCQQERDLQVPPPEFGKKPKGPI